jgi:recombination protein RecR
MELPSRLLEKTVEHFASLPGVGKRTALRYALELLKMPKQNSTGFGESIIDLVNGLQFCSTCHNISDDNQCEICLHPKRDKQMICVVEDLRDLLAIESTGQFFGVYHVLGGVISPMDGITPGDLNIESLVSRGLSAETREVIFALPATMEGDTTCFYLYKKMASAQVKLTSLARGVAIGNELQYTDEVTLGRSLLSRLPYESSLNAN